MQKREELLKKHPYAIWEGTNQKWYTYLPDKEKGRVLKKRNTQQEIEDIVVDYLVEVEENPTVEELFLEWREYQEAVYHVQSALSVLSVRADWDTPSVQAELQARRSNAFSQYSLSYRAQAPFLVLLQASGIEDVGDYLMIAVKIADESEYYRWQPQALPFC